MRNKKKIYREEDGVRILAQIVLIRLHKKEHEILAKNITG